MSSGPDAERLRSIIAVAREIAAACMDLDSTRQLIAARAASLTEAESGAVQLEDDPTEGPQPVGGLSALAVLLGEPLRVDDARTDDRVDAGACRRLDVRSLLCVPLCHREETIGILTVLSPRPGAFDARDVETLALLGGLIAPYLANVAALDQARRESYEDPLTGLPGSRAFEGTLRGEVARAARYGLRLSLALLDVDRLGRLNEVHGREAGDAVLLRVAEVLRGVRAGDLSFRVGADEFALLLPNTPFHAARTAAERAGTQVGACGLPAGHVTVSIGVAEARSADPPGLLGSARGALGRAKERRRGLRAA